MSNEPISGEETKLMLGIWIVINVLYFIWWAVRIIKHIFKIGVWHYIEFDFSDVIMIIGWGLIILVYLGTLIANNFL